MAGRDGWLTNGTYTVDPRAMAKHMPITALAGKSRFLSTVDADKAVLDAASFADANNLWQDGKAKVYVTNHPVGVLGRTGELTSWINVYKTRTGFVHGSPGSAP